MTIWKELKGNKTSNYEAYLLTFIRAATSSLTDLEMKLNKAIERNAILENEIAAKDHLTEQAQRLKDELNGKQNRSLPCV